MARDSLKKVRDDLGRRIAALEQQVAAPVPAPVYGPRLTAPAYTIAEDAVRLGLDGVDHNAGFIFVNRSMALPAGISFVGYTLMVDGNGVEVSAADCWFDRPIAQPLVAIGWNDVGSKPVVRLSNFDLKHSQPTMPHQQIAIAAASGDLYIDAGYFHDGPGAFVASSSAGALQISRTKFGAPGKRAYADPSNPADNAHTEAFHAAGGAVTVSDCDFDCSDHGGLVPKGVVTALAFLQARVAPISAKIERCRFHGLAGVPIWYAIATDANAKGATVTLTDNLIEKPTAMGSGDYVGNTGAVIARSGNKDFGTLTPIL